MDPNKLEDYLRIRNANSKIRKRLKAVIPVHLYGQPADMDGILEIAERYDLMVIEDGCQAHGATYFSREKNRWIKAGSMGLAAAFSFYPGKNLGACGEGGAVITNDEAIAQEVLMLRDHGQQTKYHHDKEGYNGRLDAIQAGFLRIKLKYLDEWNEKRRKCAYRYNKMLAGVDNVITPYEPPWVSPVYHLYVIRTQKREELQGHLLSNNIATGLHYPIPLHLQKAYKSLGYNMGDLPISEKLSQEILSLPMYPELEIHQLEKIVSSIKEFFSS
jgi:dTDP-4-amino-4,6-dideoxygalactose transaminase